MKNKISIGILLITLISNFNYLRAQETATVQKTRTKSNNSNDKTMASSLCVVSLKCTDKSCEVDYNNYSTPSDAVAGNNPEKRMHKPLIIAKQSDGIPITDNTVAQTRDASSGMTTGKIVSVATVSDVSGKVMCHDDWSTSTKLSLVNGEYILPINCTTSKSEVELSWNWDDSNAVNSSSKTHTSARFILTMNNGICTDMAINEKDTGIMPSHK